MKMHPGTTIFSAVFFGAFALSCGAQTVLPEISVIEHPHEESHGGYLISGNFKVDDHLRAVIFPAEAFKQDDIIDVQIIQMLHDEYFVLQECISVDCTQAQIVRVWNAQGALGVNFHNPFRLWIPHEGKYFFWLQQFPMPDGYQFTAYQRFSPPLVLNPEGSADAFHSTNVEAAQTGGPTLVRQTEFEGASFVATFVSGSAVRVKRARPQH